MRLFKVGFTNIKNMKPVQSLFCQRGAFKQDFFWLPIEENQHLVSLYGVIGPDLSRFFLWRLFLAAILGPEISVFLRFTALTDAGQVTGMVDFLKDLCHSPRIREQQAIDIQTTVVIGEQVPSIAGKMSRHLSIIDSWEVLAREAEFRPIAMAARCSSSLRQLERFFAANFRKTPKVWARELRCKLATELLAQGWTNKAVATELDFANESHLCHEFRRVYGVAPRSFALTHRRAGNVAFLQ
jgi:AraC-like DNA-binding protein